MIAFPDDNCLRNTCQLSSETPVQSIIRMYRYESMTYQINKFKNEKFVVNIF